MEQETRRERQAAGIADAKSAGVYLGRRSGTTKAKPARAQQLRAVLGLIVVGIGSLKLGIPQAIARYGINYISDGMMEVSERQHAEHQSSL